MTLAEWTGEHTEYALRYVAPDDFKGVVAEVSHHKFLAENSKKRHEANGFSLEVVERTVAYGDWRVSA